MYHSNNISIYYELLLDWMELKQNGIRIEEYLLKKSIYRIALYGMNRMADCFIEEVKDSSIEIKCVSDQNPNVSLLYPMYEFCMLHQITDVDAIVVFPVIQFEEIHCELQKYVSCPIYSIEEIIKNI